MLELCFFLSRQHSICTDHYFVSATGAKWITIINGVHYFKKRCLAAFSLRNLIVFD